MTRTEPHLADDGVTPVSPPEPRSALFWDGSAWRVARVDAAGQLQVDIAASTVPGGIATEATLASADAYLGLLAVLWNCLRTVGTDRFMVKGEDQLFSFKGPLAKWKSTTVSGADGFIQSDAVPGGEVWVVTTVAAKDVTNPVTAITFSQDHDGLGIAFHEDRRAIAADEYATWSGHVYLDPEDWIRAHFDDALVNDSCRLGFLGYIMTLET